MTSYSPHLEYKNGTFRVRKTGLHVRRDSLSTARGPTNARPVPGDAARLDALRLHCRLQRKHQRSLPGQSRLRSVPRSTTGGARCQSQRQVLYSVIHIQRLHKGLFTCCCCWYVTSAQCTKEKYTSLKYIGHVGTLPQRLLSGASMTKFSPLLSPSSLPFLPSLF